MMKPARTSFLTNMETRISILTNGTGHPVLLLHGNPGGKDDFGAVLDILAYQGCQCLAIDRPGHSNSEELIPEKPEPWLDVDAFAEIIEQKLSNKAFVIGYSLGGFLALKLALKHPDKVAGIGLVSPYLVPQDLSVKQSGIPGMAKSPFWGTILGLLLPTLSGGKIKAHLSRVHLPKTIPEATLAKELNRYGKFESLVAMIADKNAMIELREEILKRLGEIRCPVSLISGKQDEVCSTEKQVVVVENSFPNLRKLILDEAGHGLPFTNPKEIADFLLPQIQSCFKS